MERKLRKCQNTLYITGIAVIIFGLWSVVKAVLNATLNAGATRDLFRYLGKDIMADPENILTENQVFLVFYIIYGILIAAELLLRLYVGTRAMKEGKNSKTGYLYIVLGVVIVLFNAFSVQYALKNFTDSSDPTSTFFDKISIIVVETVSFILTLDMIISAVRVKRLLRKINDGKNDGGMSIGVSETEGRDVSCS